MCFLDWMGSELASGVVSVAFPGHVMIRHIEPHKCDRDCVRALRLEMARLAAKVADDAIDLLDHGLCEDLDLGAYVDFRSWGDWYEMVGIGLRGVSGDDGSERAVASARLDARRNTLRIEGDSTRVNIAVKRAVDGQAVQVVEQEVGDPVSELGISMNVTPAPVCVLELVSRRKSAAAGVGSGI